MFKKGINSYLNLDEANELIDGIDTTGKWRELTDGERKQYLVLQQYILTALCLHLENIRLNSSYNFQEEEIRKYQELYCWHRLSKHLHYLTHKQCKEIPCVNKV